MRTVSGSPCSACRMKLLTTRPSFMCILEPKVLKILATLTSTPSCKQRHKRAFFSNFYLEIWVFHLVDLESLALTKPGSKCNVNFVHIVYRHVSLMILRTHMNFLWKVKISELIQTRVSQTEKQLKARSGSWSSMSSTYAAHMPLVILDVCKSGSVTRESGAKDSSSAMVDVNHSCLRLIVT